MVALRVAFGGRSIAVVSIAVALFVIGCASRPRGAAAGGGPATLEAALAMLEARDAWQAHPPIHLPRHPAERFLRGWVIVLDPGHGGDAHRTGYKRGPTGEREAEMNWRVAVLLKKLLEDAGVKVILTRDGDEDVSLADRAAIANRAVRTDGVVGADLFLSLHHNATGTGASDVNYTSVWYHAEVDWSEPSLDVARYLSHAIGRALRTQVGTVSPLMSDQQIYQGGFGVLRDLRVPGVLIESSFYSNVDEEQRLRDAVYNLREAYAIYEALCEYAYGGRPTQSLPTARVSGDRVILTTTLDDGLPRQWWGGDRNRIISSTVTARLGGATLDVTFDPKTRRLTIQGPTLAQLRSGAAIVSIHHANLFKHHNFPQRYQLKLSEAGGIDIEPLGQRRAVRVPD